MTRFRLGRAFYLRLPCASLLLIVAVATTCIPAHAQQAPLLCSARPQAAAVAFFEFIEVRNGDAKLRREKDRVLSRLLTQRGDMEAIISVVHSANAQYSFDNEVPLSKRLAGEPRILRPGAPGYNPKAHVSVRVDAFTARGKVDQRVSLICEDSVWKVVSFSYGLAR